MAIMSGNSLIAVSDPAFTPRLTSWGDRMNRKEIEEVIRRKYPEMADLLICIAFKESSFNQFAMGDSGLAHGLFQIHIDKHPVSETCAFDVECSLDYTAQKIKEGRGYLWSTFKGCIN